MTEDKIIRIAGYDRVSTVDQTYGTSLDSQREAIEKYAEKLKAEGSEVSVYKFDIEEGREMAAELNVRSIPTLKGFADGEVRVSRSGVMQEPQLEEMKEQLLS